MRLATVAVCLLIVSAGCVIEERGTETATPSTPERVEGSAETPDQPATPSSGKYDVEVATLEDLVHEEMNERRSEHGLESLDRSEKLNAIARYKSWDMAQRNYYSHSGPEGTTHSMLRARFQSSCPTSGQNILKHPQGAEGGGLDTSDLHEWANDTVNVLMNSSGHRKNILNPEYELQGIGIFVDENGTVFLTQEFCG
jgi:uncharacterized protein YkwD